MVFSVELLFSALNAMGLSLNTAKTKKKCTKTAASSHAAIGEGQVEVLSSAATHKCLYAGHVKKKRNFASERDVKRGDVASPLFFNAGLELALGPWKRR